MKGKTALGDMSASETNGIPGNLIISPGGKSPQFGIKAES